MKFRKKPVIIDAEPVKKLIQLATNDWTELPYWIKEAYELGIIIFLPNSISIRTLAGIMQASKDDFILRGVKGELYPCKPDIFEQTYEAVG